MKEHRMQRRTLLAGATAAGLAMATGGSWAQSAWPNKPVKPHAKRYLFNSCQRLSNKR